MNHTTTHHPDSPASSHAGAPARRQVPPILWLAVLTPALCCLAAAATAAEPPPPSPRDHGAAAAVGLAVMVALTLVLKAARVASATLAGSLVPWLTERGGAWLIRRPVRCFLLGVLDLLAALTVLIVLAKSAKGEPLIGAVMLLFLLGVFLLGILGLSSIYAAIGCRLRSARPAGEPAGLPGDILKGGTLLETALLLPVAGWLGEFVVACLALSIGVLLILARHPKEPASRPDLEQ